MAKGMVDRLPKEWFTRIVEAVVLLREWVLSAVDVTVGTEDDSCRILTFL